MTMGRKDANFSTQNLHNTVILKTILKLLCATVYKTCLTNINLVKYVSIRKTNTNNKGHFIIFIRFSITWYNKVPIRKNPL